MRPFLGLPPNQIFRVLCRDCDGGAFMSELKESLTHPPGRVRLKQDGSLRPRIRDILAVLDAERELLRLRLEF